MSALTRHWSTFFNGMQVDLDTFKKELGGETAKQEYDGNGFGVAGRTSIVASAGQPTGRTQRMTAYNVVRFKVKPGQEKPFLDKEMALAPKMGGLRRLALVKTGERDFCLVGEWDRMDDIVKARAEMIASLDQVRTMLEDLGGGLGVTDPVSGEAVFEKAF